HDGYARRLHLYVLAGDERIDGRPYLAEIPLVPRGLDGVPSCRLTMRLSRRPTLEDASLGPLVDQGALTLPLSTDAGLAPPYRPPFVRAATCTIEGASISLSSSSGAGAGASMLISSTALGSDAAFAVWNALHGAPTRVVLRLVLDLRGTGAPAGAVTFERP